MLPSRMLSLNSCWGDKVAVRVALYAVGYSPLASCQRRRSCTSSRLRNTTTCSITPTSLSQPRRFASMADHSFVPGIVFTTIDGTDKAKALARVLVESKLAGCVQIKEVTSVYRWDGEIQMDPEYQLTVKCDLTRYSDLEKLIKSKHSYDCPQIVAVEIVKGSPQYLEWLKTETWPESDSGKK